LVFDPNFQYAVRQDLPTSSECAANNKQGGEALEIAESRHVMFDIHGQMVWW
jgi:hypothetical protein